MFFSGDRVLFLFVAFSPFLDRNKDCLKAHDIAFEIAKMIAIALRNASKKRLENRGSIPSNAGSVNNSEAEQNAGSIPAPSTSSVSAGGGGTSQSPTGDGSSASPASEGGSAGPDNGAKAPVVATDQSQDKPRPVLTMVQHLCVSAPERAEGRAKVAGGLKGLLPELEESDRARFVKFLVKVRDSGGFIIQHLQRSAGYQHHSSGLIVNGLPVPDFFGRTRYLGG